LAADLCARSCAQLAAPDRRRSLTALSETLLQKKSGPAWNAREKDDQGAGVGNDFQLDSIASRSERRRFHQFSEFGTYSWFGEPRRPLFERRRGGQILGSVATPNIPRYS
jgi:hypothetical protein